MKRFLIALIITVAISLAVMPVAVSATPVSSNPVALHVEVLADTISISVAPADIQFGQLAPGATSADFTVTITNNSTRAVNLTASATAEFFQSNLRIDDFPVANWGVLPAISLGLGDTRNAAVKLIVPSDTPPGSINGSLTFWAE